MPVRVKIKQENVLDVFLKIGRKGKSKIKENNNPMTQYTPISRIPNNTIEIEF